ncbi:MAG TPA: NADH-quinone oxidoreductase subunit L [Alphaproteobacteria bacterium]|nr:NADH-quinone oxidoreductase subunit L [Alphaproteobacteria bacterium]
MPGSLWLVPALPLAGFAVLALTPRLSQRAIATVAAGAVGLSALVAIGIAAAYIAAPPPGGAQAETLWRWFDVGGLRAHVGLYLDPLAVVMMLVITVIGFLIHLYSTEFMAGDEGYRRFFAYLNLFVAAMLLLVLADNLAFLFVGWEGVGLCSYLLIGFWYRDPANGYAARKAFVVTRIGDAAMAVGLFLILRELGTLDIQAVMAEARHAWSPGSPVAVAAALLLLGGAVGKSAQLPLQVWLPDAMAGPTPVSALIHAATMVTAGVYLIARTHILFTLAPAVQLLVAIIGAATLLIAAVSAAGQNDIKRILAYSTISQIGYMVLALGLGAWAAGIFHLVTHACFKALLFLSAGVVIEGLDDEHDIRRMGGLRRSLPEAFWPFLIGAAALAALPLVTAGFYSKDLILWRAWSLGPGGGWLWAAGLVGALLTGLYIFRAVALAFFGEAKTAVSRRPGGRIMLPLVVLSGLSIGIGWIELPATLGGLHLLSGFLAGALPAPPERHAPGMEAVLLVIGAAASLLGIAAALYLYLRRPAPAGALARQVWAHALAAWFAAGLGFDWLYGRCIVLPFMALARASARDVVDRLYDGVIRTIIGLHDLLSDTESGRLRLYAGGIALGSVLAMAVVVLT